MNLFLPLAQSAGIGAGLWFLLVGLPTFIMLLAFVAFFAFDPKRPSKKTN